MTSGPKFSENRPRPRPASAQGLAELSSLDPIPFPYHWFRSTEDRSEAPHGSVTGLQAQSRPGRGVSDRKALTPAPFPVQTGVLRETHIVNWVGVGVGQTTTGSAAVIVKM